MRYQAEKQTFLHLIEVVRQLEAGKSRGEVASYLTQAGLSESASEELVREAETLRSEQSASERLGEGRRKRVKLQLAFILFGFMAAAVGFMIFIAPEFERSAGYKARAVKSVMIVGAVWIGLFIKLVPPRMKVIQEATVPLVKGLRAAYEAQHGGGRR